MLQLRSFVPRVGKIGDAEKEKGNDAFRRGDFDSALKHYDSAISVAGEIGSNLAALYSNKAASLRKLGKFSDCVLMCHYAAFAADVTKELLFKNAGRLGEAYEAQGKFEEAVASLEHAVHHIQSSDVVSARIAGLKAKLHNVKKYVQGYPPTLEVFIAKLVCVLQRNLPSLKPTLNEFEIDYGQLKSRDVLLSEHAEILMAVKKYYPDLGKILGDPRTASLLPPPVKCLASPACAAELHELQRINIDQLRFEEVNVGKVLICRGIVDPYNIHAPSTVIEDPAGNVVRFHAYNTCTHRTNPCSVMPVGGHFAIKEPLFKTGCVIGRPAVIIENRSQLISLEFTHYLLEGLTWQTPWFDIPGLDAVRFPADTPMWQALQLLGNDEFDDGCFEYAALRYTDAIRLKEEGCKADLYSNRAAAYLKQGKFVQAIADCYSARQLKPGHVKAAFRLAKGYAGLGDFSRARGVLARHASAESPDFANEIARLEQLILEQNVGQFDLKGLLKRAVACETIRFDHAEYNADGIACNWISDAKGFGLVAPRDYAPGDLIFVSKALAVVYNSEVLHSTTGCTLDCEARRDCVSRVLQRVEKDPGYIKELNQLYAGPNMDYNMKDATAVDPSRVDAIVSLNRFGVASKTTDQGENLGCRRSAFEFGGCGLWLLPSFLTHSCVPNTSRMFVGDLMFIRAAVPIAKGDELRTRKVDGDFAERRDTLAEKYGFLCDCELCECDKKRCDANPRLDEKRRAKFCEFWDVYKGCVQPVSESETEIINAKHVGSVQEAAEQFANRYAYKNRFDEYLSRIYGALGLIYNRQGKFAKAAMAYENAFFALLGKESQLGRSLFIADTQPRFAVTLCVLAALNFFWAGNKEMGKHYYGQLLRLAKQICGSEDLEIVSLLFPKLQIKLLEDEVEK